MTEPDGVTMYAGEEWVDLGASCPHRCHHDHRTYVGKGTTYQRHRLVRCDSCGCRGWKDRRASREFTDAAWWAGQVHFRVASAP